MLRSSTRSLPCLFLIAAAACYVGPDAPQGAEGSTSGPDSGGVLDELAPATGDIGDTSDISDTGAITTGADVDADAAPTRFDTCAACNCLLWSAHTPNPGGDAETVTALAVMPDGGALLAAATTTQLHLRRFTPAGAPSWERVIDGAFTDLHLVPVGDAFFALGGSFTGTLTLSDPPAFSAGETDGFLALLPDAAAGTPVWHRSFGDKAAQRVHGLVAAGDCAEADLSGCSLGVAGVGSGALGLAGLKLADAGQVFLATLPAALPNEGEVRVRALADGVPHATAAPALAALADGRLALSTALRFADDDGDLILYRWDASADRLDTLRFHAPGEQRGGALAVGPDDSLRLTARTLAAIDLGLGTFGASDDETPFLAILDADLELLATRPLAAWPAPGRALAVFPDGSTALTGHLFADADLGGGPLVHRGASDAFLAQYDARGVHQCSRNYGDLDEQRGLSVVTGADGRGLVLLRVRGAVDPHRGTWEPSDGGTELVLLALRQ